MHSIGMRAIREPTATDTQWIEKGDAERREMVRRGRRRKKKGKRKV